MKLKPPKRPKCDYCNNTADAKEGDKPQYLCASCWLKFHGPNSKETNYGQNSNS